VPLAEIDGDVIAVYADWRDKELITQVPGSRYDKDRDAWTLPIAWGPCVQLRSLFGDALQVGPFLARWSRSERSLAVDPCLALRTAQDADMGESTFADRLYPFQRAGVKFMATAGRALNADEMGLGKSVQTVMTLEELGDDAYPALIVCPNSMKYVWQDEFRSWAPHRRVSVAGGTAKARREAIELVSKGTYDVVVINWESLRSHTRLAAYPSVSLSDAEKELKELNYIPFATVVADEAHRGKDPRAKQTRALWYLGDRAGNAFALSGTPIANSPEDCWALMRFVSPDEYPVKSKWIDRYGLQSWSPYGTLQVVGLKAEHRDELFRIMDPRFIRRTKDAVLTQLPPKVYATRTVEMGAKQRRAYEQMRKHMVAELDNGALVASNPLTHLTRLLQFAAATAELGPDGNPVMTEPSCKVDALEELAEELGGAKAVVFTQSVQLARMCSARLERLGYRHGAITGDVPTTDRMGYIRRFQEGDLQFMVVTLGAGGEGITLTAAQTAIFLQRSFSLPKNLQAEDRLHRIGQTGSVEIIDVVTQGTAETRVVDAIVRKGMMAEEIVRDADTLREWLG
jgi:SNF2 family DNA or RNA helicase